VAKRLTGVSRRGGDTQGKLDLLRRTLDKIASKESEGALILTGKTTTTADRTQEVLRDAYNMSLTSFVRLDDGNGGFRFQLGWSSLDGPDTLG